MNKLFLLLVTATVACAQVALGPDANLFQPLPLPPQVEPPKPIPPDVVWVPFSETTITYTEWLPDASTVTEGEVFKQHRSKQTTTRSGERSKRGERNVRVIQEESNESRLAIGSRKLTLDEWVAFIDVTTSYGEWAPAADTVPQGASFEQFRAKSIVTRKGFRNARGQERDVTVLVGDCRESRKVLGTQIVWMPFTDITKTCEAWLPLPESVNVGDRFVQSRQILTYTRTGERNRSGQERGVKESKDVRSEHQTAIGTLARWIHFQDANTVAGEWRHNTDAIPWGEGFVQVRTVTTTYREGERCRGEERGVRVVTNSWEDTRDAVGTRAFGLANVSLRATVGPNSATAGFVLDCPARILIRAAGPSLGALGVAQPLADPQLQLFSRNVLIASNDNWDESITAASKAAGLFPFSSESLDAGIIRELPAGSYTVVIPVTGTGEVLLEVTRLLPGR